jgi:hypothetical protein
MEECRTRMPRKIFGPKTVKLVTRDDYKMGNFMICTVHLI